MEKEKLQNPTKFASHWEMDEEDVDEATEEEKQSTYLFLLSLPMQYSHTVVNRVVDFNQGQKRQSLVRTGFKTP